MNAATRVFYALARNDLAPRPLGRTHPRFKTPHVAIIWMSAFALALSLAFGWKWGPLIGFAFIATWAVPLVVVVYMLVCVGCMWHYLRRERSAFNPLLHLVMPLGGIVLFFFPLYYQFYKLPPTYPIKNANWIAIAWAALGVVLTIGVVLFAPRRLRDVDRVYVEDETVVPEGVGAAPAVT